MNRSFNRRRALAAFGSVSLGALIAACGGGGGDNGDSTTDVSTTDGGTTTVEPKTSTGAATADLFDDSSSCTLTAEETEGPYYFDADSIRSDIREDREGTRLRLAIRVRDADSCEPLKNAVVDLWHCDALGSYSGFEAASGGGPGGGGRTDDEKYLRGAQVTNSDGIVEFVTVYPGWYQGRTVHIHGKVHVDNQTALTTQFYFDDKISDRVYEGSPYSQHGSRDVLNANDNIFDQSMLLDLSRDGDGYLGVISLDVKAA